MHSRLLRLIGCSAVWAVSACGDKPTEVELRLYPCALISGAPTSVALTIQSHGADGEKIGEPLAKTFPIADPGVFDDGFATVGFTPPGGTLTADITVVWTAGDEAVQATYNLTVPAIGESMDLGSSECEGGPGTTTSMTTMEPSTVGPDTTDSTTSGTSSETGTTGTTGTTETTSTSTSTSTGTETTTDSGTTTTTTTETSTTDMTTGTTGTTGGPMAGDDCDSEGALVCNGGPGVLGDLLQCALGKWALKNDFCSADTACAELGFVNPQIVGCMGSEQAWSCACAESPQGECGMSMQSECGGPLSDGVLVQLCVEDGGNTWHYAAQCPACKVVDGQPLCTLR